MKISYNWLKEYINFDQSLEEIGERPTRNQAYSYTYFLANAQRKESAEQLRNLVKKGVLGGPVMEYEDIYATYEELKSKGVKLTKQPTKEFYKTEAVFKDDSGNWFSLGERKKYKQLPTMVDVAQLSLKRGLFRNLTPAVSRFFSVSPIFHWLLPIGHSYKHSVNDRLLFNFQFLSKFLRRDCSGIPSMVVTENVFCYFR